MGGRQGAELAACVGNGGLACPPSKDLQHIWPSHNTAGLHFCTRAKCSELVNIWTFLWEGCVFKCHPRRAVVQKDWAQLFQWATNSTPISAGKSPEKLWYNLRGVLYCNNYIIIFLYFEWVLAMERHFSIFPVSYDTVFKSPRLLTGPLCFISHSLSSRIHQIRLFSVVWIHQSRLSDVSKCGHFNDSIIIVCLRKFWF